jgi:hypothetical protein
MNQITPDQLLAKIGLLTMENDILRAELGKCQEKIKQLESAKESAKEPVREPVKE